jgi:hypothetical protein
MIKILFNIYFKSYGETVKYVGVAMLGNGFYIKYTKILWRFYFKQHLLWKEFK